MGLYPGLQFQVIGHKKTIVKPDAGLDTQGRKLRAYIALTRASGFIFGFVIPLVFSTLIRVFVRHNET
jgi:tetrahydromethanopterin S-methyltransferase subunit F